MSSVWLPGRLACVALATLISASSVFGQNDTPAPPAPTAKPDAAAAEEAPPVDPFKIPEGNDAEELQEFMGRLSRVRPEATGPEGQREHLRKMEGVVAQIQAKELDEPTALMAADFRFQLLTVLERVGDEGATERKKTLIEQLSKSKQPKVAERGKIYGLASRVGRIGELKSDDRKKLIDDIAAFIREGEVSQERYELASKSAEFLVQVEDNELASKALEQYAAAFESRKDERIAELVERLRATGRRYGLVGKPMEVKGKTIDGKDFNLESLKGKMVLVDFWATWCGPCLQEMPHVRELYTGYRGKGFEVVGVSLDEKKEELVAFLNEEKLPWIQLYSEADGDGGWSNPIARHYGISAIPTAILVGKDGNVVSLNATGHELSRLLEKHLGPPEMTPETPAEETPKK